MKKLVHLFLILLLSISFIICFSQKISAQEFMINIEPFIEMNLGIQSYTYLTFTAEDPWIYVYPLHAGLRFSFFPVNRINNHIYNNLPLGLTFMVSYFDCNDLGRYDGWNTSLGRGYFLQYLRFTLMLGYGKAVIQSDGVGRHTAMLNINAGFYYSKFLYGYYWGDQQIKYYEGVTPEGHIADDFGIRIELYANYSIGFKGFSFVGISMSIFVDINLRDLITTEEEKLTYWSWGVYFGWPINF